ncbi:GntR family transcriptional regulator [Alteromonadaceae bacterium M269]|nr:GntR family transcriptional regulator [Alteromonadaceae bacterium M269]
MKSMTEQNLPDDEKALLETLKQGLNSQSASPLYIQLDQTLRQAIDNGLLSHGESLPPERTIAESLGISRVTVRKTIQRLEQAGFCEKRRGAGTFVCGPTSIDGSHTLPQSLCSLYGFSEDMQRRGLKPESQFIDKRTAAPSAEEMFALNLKGESIVRLTRIRLADGKPMAIEICSIPCSVIANEDLIQDSVYQAMREAGHKPHRAVQRISACALDDEQADRLEVESGAPALFIRRAAYDVQDKPLEYTRTYYRADRFDFVAELVSE